MSQGHDIHATIKSLAKQLNAAAQGNPHKSVEVATCDGINNEVGLKLRGELFFLLSQEKDYLHYERIESVIGTSFSIFNNLTPEGEKMLIDRLSESVVTVSRLLANNRNLPSLRFGCTIKPGIPFSVC